jgi:hypothetical protein
MKVRLNRKNVARASQISAKCRKRAQTSAKRRNHSAKRRKMTHSAQKMTPTPTQKGTNMKKLALTGRDVREMLLNNKKSQSWLSRKLSDLWKEKVSKDKVNRTLLKYEFEEMPPMWIAALPEVFGKDVIAAWEGKRSEQGLGDTTLSKPSRTYTINEFVVKIQTW